MCRHFQTSRGPSSPIGRRRFSNSTSAPSFWKRIKAPNVPFVKYSLRTETKFCHETARKQFRIPVTRRKFASIRFDHGDVYLERAAEKGQAFAPWPVDPLDTVDDAMIHSCLPARSKLRTTYDTMQKDKCTQMRDAYVGSTWCIAVLRVTINGSRRTAMQVSCRNSRDYL